jgi:hypothetical protein
MLTVCLYLPARLEVGFDETAQTCTEYAPNDIPDTVQRPPYCVWVGASAKGGTKIISLVHSLVVTLQVRAFGDDAADGSFQAFLQEEVVLPSLPISTTDYQCVGKAVFKALDKYAFDDLLQFIRRIEVVGLILIVGTADRASSNLKFMRVWRALCALACLSAVQLISEPCALHQMQRANCSLLLATKVGKHVKKALSLLRLRRSRRAYQESMLQEFAATLDFNGVPVSEEQAARNSRVNKCLVFLFTHKVNAAKFLLNRDDEDVQQAEEAQRVRDLALHEFVNVFLNNCSVADVAPARIDAWQSKAATVAYGKVLINDMLWRSAPPRYNEARWLAFSTASEWHSMSALVCGFGYGAWGRVKLQCESKSSVTESQVEDNQRKEAGENLKAIRTFAKGDFSRFFVVLQFVMLKANEALIHVLFAASGVRLENHNKNARSRRQRLRDDAAAKVATRVKMSVVMVAVEEHVHRLWSMLTDNPDDITSKDDDKWPLLFLAEAYWPHHRAPEQECHRIALDCVLDQCAEVYHRFLIEHRNAPYSLIARGGGLVDEEKGSAFLRARHCCVRHVQPLREYCVNDRWSHHGGPLRRLQKGVRALNSSLNATSLAQEHLLGDQRKHMKSTDRQPSTYARSACVTVQRGVSATWASKGGRDLSTASKVLQDKRDSAEDCGSAYKNRNVAYSKPNAFGNPMFSFFAERMSPEAVQFVLLAACHVFVVSVVR